ncbi:carbonic anhydrase [Aquabacterium sp.]|uniref:carbonic anhydrase n=1 Tax=Aquabacterium sp. TaxID=1872578 RepID=UPI0035ADFCDA
MPARTSVQPVPRRFTYTHLALGALVLLTGMTLAGHAHASETHGASHDSAGGASSVETPRVTISKEELKRKAMKPEGAAEPAASSGSSVSMTDLRDMIDQKIAEVRAKQKAAPMVKVTNRSPAAAKAAKAAKAGSHDASGALLPGGAEHGGHDIHWDYAGAGAPPNWGQLKPEFQTCSVGKRQSPIDIRDGIKVQLEPIQFDYHQTPFRVIDNGHTVQVNVDPGNTITVSGRRYELVQFHFHRPSEERINGRQYEMVAHLVHKDAEGHLAVIAVLMDQGRDNPMVQLVWNSLPLEKNIEQGSPVMMDLNLMLPEQRQYYTYMGSLTTPPCTEGVLWMVMKQPATMSRDQIAIFTRLYANNARPVQSTSGRLIKEGM